MTAIYGLWRKDHLDESIGFERVAAGCRKYGNSRPTRWQAPGLSLGRCLFSNLVEDDLGDPLERDQGRFAVAADVLLSEREDLARQLACRATDFSDADLVALALERWGEDAFARIYGPFAIAAWDRTDRRLILARDVMGERPLYFHAGERLCAFASMPVPLFALPEISRQPDPDQYAQFLRMQTCLPGRTPYADLREVRAGYVVIVDDSAVTEREWWKPDLTPLDHADQADYERDLAERLERAVRSAMRSRGGKIGAHLSGGFDSTAVATTAARFLADDGKRLTTYVAVPHDVSLPPMPDHCFADEGPYAEATAQATPNIDLTKVTSSHGPLAKIDQVNTIYPGPILNLCGLAWFEAINDQAREDGVSIMLHGSMGNYTISESGTLALPWLFRHRRWRVWFQISRDLVKNRWMRWRGILWNSIEHRAPLWLSMAVGRLTGRSLSSFQDCVLIKTEAYETLGKIAADAAQAAGLPPPDDDEFDREMQIDSVQYRLQARGGCHGEFYKAMLGEWKIAFRDPTADRRLFEWCLRVPVERLIWGGEPRAILRAVLADRVPDMVLHTRKRGLQGTDWVSLLDQDRDSLLEQLETLRDQGSLAAFVDRDRIQALIDNIPPSGSTEWMSYESEKAYRYAAMRTISAASHLRQASGENH